ncbi:MAG: ATP-binding protein [Fimbriimonas sp.]|nr:ATP-binding protein [Fimbriimonas sp.]
MIERQAARTLTEALADTPVVLIHGPRQSGKSTLGQNLEVKRTYVTLDDPIALGLARRDPKAFLKTYPAPVMIDEVQRAPELFLAIKLDVDRDRRPGKYLLTGSANVLNLPKLADSLAGRMEIVDLLPFSQGELELLPDSFVDHAFEDEFAPLFEPEDLKSLVDRMVRGGFPEASLRSSQARRESWFANYVRTLLERDVKDVANIDALAQMPLLLRLLAARSGSTLNAASLATETGIPYTSLKRYLSLLETIFLLRLVNTWSHDRSRILTKAPKAYMVDTGLLCYLANLEARTLLSDSLRLKPVLENFVAMEFQKQCSFGAVRPWLLHLRTIRHLSVDFVLESRRGDVVGIQIKAGTTLHEDDAEGLRFLRDLAGPNFKRGIVLYVGDAMQPLDDQIVGVPIGAIWR